MGGGGYLLQSDFDRVVDQAQQQMADPYQIEAQEAYTEVPSDPEEWFDLATDNWMVGAIFVIGIISIVIVAFRVFRKNPWVDELIKMWSTH